MAALHADLMKGFLSQVASASATTLTSPEFAALPTVVAPDTLDLTLDPDQRFGAPEVVQVVAHSAASSSVTVVRAQRGTTARNHQVQTRWVHGLYAGEFDAVLTDLTNKGTQISSLDTLKAPKASPTFTGAVTVPTPTNSTDASTKAYVDTQVGLQVPRAGGVTVTGDLTLAATRSVTLGKDPDAAFMAATKQYVDAGDRFKIVADATARDAAFPSPTKGDSCYVVALNEYQVYASSAAGWRPPWNVAWGHVATATDANLRAGFDTSLTEINTGLRVTVPSTYPAGRRLRVTVHLLVDTGNGGGASVQVYNVTGAAAVGLVGSQSTTTGTGALFEGSVRFTSTGSEVVLTPRIQSIGAATTVNVEGGVELSWVTVEDVGPASAPA